jgi:iron complex transport system ATP-binding protein
VSEALSFEGVGFRAGGREILAGLSLTLGRGELLTLAGPNGAGKTTLLRLASRVATPSAGRVRVAGRDASELSRRELARELAVVPQDVSLAFPFSAGEVVLMGRAPHLGLLGFETADDVGRAREAMERVGVAHLADRSVLELSGGERQLLLLARALAQDARVLLLDEPTSHLDLRHRVTVLEQVRDFVASGRSALVVSHDLGLAARGADRLALLAGGRLAGLGTPDQVLRPEILRAVFGVETSIVEAPGGGVVVVPRLGGDPVR